MSWLIWLWDVIYKTPLIDAAEIPRRSLRYTTTAAIARLTADGLVSPTERRPCLGSHNYNICNARTVEEMKEAKREGRFVDYERMKIFNGEKLREGED